MKKIILNVLVLFHLLPSYAQELLCHARPGFMNFGGLQSSPDLNDHEERCIVAIQQAKDRSKMSCYDGPQIHKIQAARGITIPTCETVQKTLRDAFSAILAGDLEPKYIAQCPDIPQNRDILIEEICQLYSNFFANALREEVLCEILKQNGMWLQLRYSYDPIPSPEQTTRFTNALKQYLTKAFDQGKNKRIWVHIGYDYGPTSPPLQFAFEEADLNNDFYYLLPYKSHTHIHIDQGIISLNLDLRGPPF